MTFITCGFHQLQRLPRLRRPAAASVLARSCIRPAPQTQSQRRLSSLGYAQSHSPPATCKGLHLQPALGISLWLHPQTQGRQRRLRLLSSSSATEPHDGSSRPLDKRIPITVLTGFLGSGKTTTLNNLLTKEHGRRIAIIENEFGEIDIDSRLVAAQEGADNRIMMLNNGCLCCTVRGDLVDMIIRLCQERRSEFDHIVIETTGLANPAPVIKAFAGAELAEMVRLDGVVTIVDAKHIGRHLDPLSPTSSSHQDDQFGSTGAPNEAIEQIGYADRIVLNKIDLVEASDAVALEERISRINAMAALERAQRGDVAVDFLLGIGGFDLNSVQRSLGIRGLSHPRPEEADGPSSSGGHDDDHSQCNHDMGRCAHDDDDHCSHHGNGHSHGLHNDAVTSVSLIQKGGLDLSKVNRWLGGLLGFQGDDIYRMKGILSVHGDDRRFVFQGVHMMFEGNPAGRWLEGEERRNEIVFIGRNLDAAELEEGLASCLDSADIEHAT